MSPFGPPPEARALVVGNDVVDLSDPRCSEKHADARFLERVFTAAERRTIAVADEPDLMLWTLWAAKEAAFKALSKHLGAPPVFRHRAFEVVLTEQGAGRVRFGESSTLFRVSSPREPLAVVAIDPRLERWPEPQDGVELFAEQIRLASPSGRGEGAPEGLLRRFSAREALAVHDLTSARVRLESRAHLARELGVAEERLEIVCAGGRTGRVPPVVLLDGLPAAADLSLSHHGHWIAWALLIPRAG
jgi:phosphopantetheine--protein transferase-like protein